MTKARILSKFNVTSANIADSTITNADIADNTITASKLLEGSITTSNISEGNNQYYTDTRVYSNVAPLLVSKADVSDLTTSNIVEIDNLYFSNARVYANVEQIGYAYNTYLNSRIDTKANISDLATSNVIEIDNLYFTNARVYANVVELNYSTNEYVNTRVDAKANISDLTTSNVTEIDNLYFSNARVYANVEQIGYAYNTYVDARFTSKANISDLTTSNVIEIDNLYFTNARAISAFTPGPGFTLNANGLITYNATGAVTSIGGASGDISNSQILASIISVDGASSGLDADLLDGEQGSYYTPLTTTTSAFNQANSAVLAATSAFAAANVKVATVAGVTDTSISNAALLAGLLTVDGSGSGLDADLLDGQSSAYYATASSLSSYLPLSGGTVTGLVTLTRNDRQIELNRADGAGPDWGIYGWGSGLNIYPINSSSTIYFGRDGQATNVECYNGNFYAPIFYDSNNTGYYVDPAGASVSASLNGPIVMSSTDWTGEVPGKIQYHSSSWYLQYSSYFHFRRADGGNTFYGDSSGNTWAIGSSRAPIFYDSDNTGYYVDPASTSRISSLETVGSDSVVFGGYFSNNHYNSISTARISFGGGNDFGNYHLGVNRENYGGDYTKLDLRWHTGIRLGAALQYGGIRFFDSEDLGSLRFHIEGGNGYTYKYTWMWTNTTGFYSDTNSWHIEPNSSSSYGATMIRGSRNGWYGIHFYNAGYTPHIMFDSSGGGLYAEGLGRWMLYHSYGNNCLGINASTTSSSYALYVTGAIYATGDITTASDKRAKENIKPLKNSLDIVEKLQGVRYNKIGDNKSEIGFLAQDVEEYLPEVVTYAEDVDQYGVSYGNITALLVEAIKELSAEVKRLKEKLGE